jgi:anti-sigma factor RsiW
MHLDEEQVQRVVHGELPRLGEIEAREHLAECVVCRDRLAVAEKEEANVFGLLRAVDHPVPAIAVGAIESRARAPDTRRLQWAAGIVLALGIAGAAYAAPGSPLPRWVSVLTGWMRAEPELTQTQSSPSPPRASGIAGVAITPGQRLVIVFTSSQTEGYAHVRLTDSAEVVVRAPSGAATFSSDADRLVIDNRGGTGTFEIQIPRTAPRVEILVDGTRRFLKDGGRITANQVPGAPGLYSIPL